MLSQAWRRWKDEGFAWDSWRKSGRPWVFRRRIMKKMRENGEEREK